MNPSPRRPAALTARILTVANRSLYRRAHAVETVTRAGSLIGFKCNRELCLITGLMDAIFADLHKHGRLPEPARMDLLGATFRELGVSAHEVKAFIPGNRSASTKLPVPWGSG